MKRILPVLWLVLLLSTPCRGWSADSEASGEKESKLSWGFTEDILSRYIWRGFAYTRGPVMQPEGWVSAYGFTFDLWSNFVLNDEPNQGQFNEVDPSLTYSHSWGPFTVEPTIENYNYPNQMNAPSTAEFDLKLSYGLGPVTLTTTHNFDIIRYRGSYFGDFTAGIEHEFFPKFSMATSASLGWGSSKFNETYGGVSKAALNLFLWRMEFVYQAFKHVSFRPHMEVNVLIDSDLRQGVSTGQSPEIVSGGLALLLTF